LLLSHLIGYKWIVNNNNYTLLGIKNRKEVFIVRYLVFNCFGECTEVKSKNPITALLKYIKTNYGKDKDIENEILKASDIVRAIDFVNEDAVLDAAICGLLKIDKEDILYSLTKNSFLPLDIDSI